MRARPSNKQVELTKLARYRSYTATTLNMEPLPSSRLPNRADLAVQSQSCTVAVQPQTVRHLQYDLNNALWAVQSRQRVTSSTISRLCRGRTISTVRHMQYNPNTCCMQYDITFCHGWNSLNSATRAVQGTSPQMSQRCSWCFFSDACDLPSQIRSFLCIVPLSEHCGPITGLRKWQYLPITGGG